jgi:hypothetical protein
LKKNNFFIKYFKKGYSHTIIVLESGDLIGFGKNKNKKLNKIIKK